MQGHLRVIVFRNKAVAAAETKIPGRAAFATSNGQQVRINYRNVTCRGR
jgi:hypothetical protein